MTILSTRTSTSDPHGGAIGHGNFKLKPTTDSKGNS
jgi:hypothetical protein